MFYIIVFISLYFIATVSSPHEEMTQSSDDNEEEITNIPSSEEKNETSEDTPDNKSQLSNMKAAGDLKGTFLLYDRDANNTDQSNESTHGVEGNENGPGDTEGTGPEGSDRETKQPEQSDENTDDENRKDNDRVDTEEARPERSDEETEQPFTHDQDIDL